MTKSTELSPWWILVPPATLFGLGARRAITLDVSAFDPLFRSSFAPILGVVIVHAISGMITLTVGPWLFIVAQRPRPPVHRWLGRLYLLAVATGGSSGLFMGLRSVGGPWARASFALLACGWLVSGALAFKHARARELVEHRRWTIRNLTLTFSAVSLRCMVHGFQFVGYELSAIYAPVAWCSWLPQILLVEWLLQRAKRRRRGASAVRLGVLRGERLGQVESAHSVK